MLHRFMYMTALCISFLYLRYNYSVIIMNTFARYSPMVPVPQHISILRQSKNSTNFYTSNYIIYYTSNCKSHKGTCSTRALEREQWDRE